MNRKYRNPIILSLVILLVVSLSSWTQAQNEDQTATIRVNLQEEKAPIPASLYGIFMEEISHAFDGGIYAELIQNRSFE